ncbi:MAG: transposase [Gammaproteobacteria bacterium]
MPRPLRIEYDDAWYHVMNRGANHQMIFYNDDHRKIFLSLLAEIKSKFQVETHAFCLMDNHYHLLLKTPLANLGKCMRHLDGVYTQRFNRLAKRDGSLFRGRYKAILVENNSYLLAVNRYIHLNPVEANICKLPIEYTWSSYQDYIGARNNNTWLHINYILKMIYDYKKSYVNFIEEGNSDELKKFYSKNHLSPILGDKHFVEDTLSKLNHEKINNSLHDVNRIKNRVEPNRILSHILNYFQTSVEEIKLSVRGKTNLPRMIAVLLFRQLGHLSHSVIAKYFNCSTENIATTLKRANSLIRHDIDVKNHIEKLVHCILR